MKDVMERSRELQIIFYANGRGGVAVSVDEGETLVLADGRVLPAGSTIWKEALDDEVEDRLSPVQRARVEQVRAKPPARGMEAVVEQYRADRLRVSRQFAQPDPEFPEVPEGALVVKSEFDD